MAEEDTVWDRDARAIAVAYTQAVFEAQSHRTAHNFLPPKAEHVASYAAGVAMKLAEHRRAQRSGNT